MKKDLEDMPAVERSTPAPRRDPAAMDAPNPKAAIHVNMKDRHPITAPYHGWFTSPARSHADVQKGKELPLHLVALILSYVGAASRGGIANQTVLPMTSSGDC